MVSAGGDRLPYHDVASLTSPLDSVPGHMSIMLTTGDHATLARRSRGGAGDPLTVRHQA